MRTFCSTGHCQMSFQSRLSPPGRSLVVCRPSAQSCSSSARLYALRIVKLPNLSGFQARKSASFWLEVRILTIACTSMGRNQRWTSCMFQDLSGFRKSETHRNRHRPCLVIGLRYDSQGIQGSRHARIFEPFPTRQMQPFLISSSPYSMALHVEDAFPPCL